MAYRIFGAKIQSATPKFEELHTQLKKGGINVYVTAYVSLIILSSMITFGASMAIFPLMLPLVMGFSFLSIPNLTFSLLFALSSTLVVAVILYAVPGLKSSQRKGPIDANLTYITSFMAMLSSSSVSPKLILESMAKIDTLREVRQEFSGMVRDAEVFGKDLLTSISENVKYVPSKRLQEILIGYVSTIRTGGDPTEYLKIATENSMKEKMIKLDLMLESLSAMAEVYIMVLVAMPLLFIALFSTLGMFGSAGGMNPATLMYMITYVMIPLMSVAITVVISSMAGD